MLDIKMYQVLFIESKNNLLHKNTLNYSFFCRVFQIPMNEEVDVTSFNQIINKMFSCENKNGFQNKAAKIY